MGRRPLLLLVLCVTLLGGCGGDGDGSANGETATTTAPRVTVYARAPTMACLRRRGLRVTTTAKAVGFIAYTAVGGALRARRPNGADVIMAFGVDGDDAAQTLLGINRAPTTEQGRLFKTKLRRSNVAILWAYPPTANQKKNVYGCLKSAG
jgi:hypothetical protein